MNIDTGSVASVTGLIKSWLIPYLLVTSWYVASVKNTTSSTKLKSPTRERTPMIDNRSKYQEPKKYGDNREPKLTCVECRRDIDGAYYIVDLHLMCVECWEARFKRLLEHQERIQSYLRKNGGTFDRNGKPVDAPGKSLSWLMEKFPGDYTSEERDKYADQ